MNCRSLILTGAMLAMTSAVWAEDAKDGPRTGYFRKTTTPVELLGEDGAKALADVFEPDQKLQWQLYVPHSYDPSKPTGVIVFITPKPNWGGSRRSYNDLLEERNLIWAGILGAGEKRPVNERVLRAILTPPLLAKDYSLDPSRIYMGGFSDGAHVAAMVATGKPDVFKGGLFIGGALSWDQKMPPRIGLIRQNRFVFVAGSIDPALNTVRMAAIDYKKDGVEHTSLIVMSNQRKEMPGPKYLEEAIRFLDDPTGAAAESDGE